MMKMGQMRKNRTRMEALLMLRLLLNLRSIKNISMPFLNWKKLKFCLSPFTKKSHSSLMFTRACMFTISSRKYRKKAQIPMMVNQEA